jgi:hypothetical protein
MKKWALSAVVYLLVVVGAYYAYASFSGNETDETNQTEGHGHATEEQTSDPSEDAGHEEGHGDSHAEHEGNSGNSEVLPMLHEESGNIVITLKDLNGNPVSDLEINHEKLMHLIVVSSDLNVYKHLHPVSNEPGIFKVEHGLEEGEYKVFVDIKPKNLAYEVQSIEFIMGSPHEGHDHGALKTDDSLVNEVGGHSATLTPTSLTSNEEIQLQFDLNGETPEQYLGALGHVVILDEEAENYIHVHPLEGDEPVFETKFTNAGIYKIWAEFKFEGEVFVFPYVVEIK